VISGNKELAAYGIPRITGITPGFYFLLSAFLLQRCADLCNKVLALPRIPALGLSPNWQEQQALLT
jgi:hypothetical protein